jgi:hypothetical protein
MAEIPYTIEVTGQEHRGVGLIKWAGLGQGDVGAPFVFPGHPDRSVHVKGTFGAGGTVVLEGSLEVVPGSYCTLNDPQGNPLSFSLEKIEQVLENAVNIRPRVSAGDVDTSLDVYLLMSK